MLSFLELLLVTRGNRENKSPSDGTYFRQTLNVQHKSVYSIKMN